MKIGQMYTGIALAFVIGLFIGIYFAKYNAKFSESKEETYVFTGNIPPPIPAELSNAMLFLNEFKKNNYNILKTKKSNSEMMLNINKKVIPLRPGNTTEFISLPKNALNGNYYLIYDKKIYLLDTIRVNLKYK